MSETNLPQHISLKDLDGERTRKMEETDNFYLAYFLLSSIPPEEWVRIFDEEFESLKTIYWRRANIEGIFLVVQCHIEYIAEQLQPHIERTIEKANERYGHFWILEKQHNDNKVEKENADKKRLQDVKSALKFGD